MRHFLCGRLLARIHACLLRTEARRMHYVYTDVVFKSCFFFNDGRVKVTQCDVARYETSRYIDPHLKKLPEPRTILESDTGWSLLCNLAQVTV